MLKPRRRQRAAPSMNGWRGTDLAEDDARQHRAGFNVTFNARTLSTD
jgi:hypothetical protein